MWGELGFIIYLSTLIRNCHVSLISFPRDLFILHYLYEFRWAGRLGAGRMGGKSLQMHSVLLSVIVSISLCYWMIIGFGGQWLFFIYFSEKEPTQQEKGLLSAVQACKCVWCAFYFYVLCLRLLCGTVFSLMHDSDVQSYTVLCPVGHCPSSNLPAVMVWRCYTRIKTTVYGLLNTDFHFILSCHLLHQKKDLHLPSGVWWIIFCCYCPYWGL